MNSGQIEILVRLGLFPDSVHAIVWLAQLDSDEAAELFAVEVGSLVWAD